jgi:ADP-ribosylglycohydrolase
MLRLTWTQPEDLVPHALRAARLDGVDVDDLADQWVAAGGSLVAPVSGATPDPAPPELRALGRTILSRVDERDAPEELRRREPDDIEQILALARPADSAPTSLPLSTPAPATSRPQPATPATSLPLSTPAPVTSRPQPPATPPTSLTQPAATPPTSRSRPAGTPAGSRPRPAGTSATSLPRPAAAPATSHVSPASDLADRIHGAWLGRAAGCLLGKPVEKIPREGIRAIAQSTGNWPIAHYFTEAGLDPAIAARYPWNRRSRPTSLAENIDGMPEDDDLNFPLIALDLLERHGDAFTTADVAQSWLVNLPGGRVFTAERIAYRNLLDGYEPDVAGAVGNPFRDWIGAQIRADVHGWTHPGDPLTAARLAWTDARLTHGRNGVYGAMFAAAACAAAVVATDVTAVIEAGLSVVPPESRFAEAINMGTELGPLSTEDALDRIHTRYGDLHWVHVLNNAAVLAFALTHGDGDYTRTITTAVTGGWDTDSTGATAGSLVGALTGAKALPAQWIDPLRNRLATSIPGFDGIGFDTLAARTMALVPK